MNSVKVVFDNNKTSVYEGNRLVAKGSDSRFRKFGENVVTSDTLKDYKVVDEMDGHKRVITFTK